MLSKRWTRSLGAVLALIVATGICATIPGCPTFKPEIENIGALVPLGKPPKDGQFVQVNDYKIFYKMAGNAEPKIVLIGGMDENVTIWDKVFDDIAEFATVVTYDRGGVGWSERGPDPRTASMIARELNDFLAAINLEPPYILCPHSLGGLYARYYAAQFPDKVSGMLLIDTSHEDMWRRQALLMTPYQVAIALDMMDLSQGLEGILQPGALGEYYNIENTTNEVRNERQIPWVPLLLLSQDMGNFAVLEKDENQPVVTLLYREFYWEQATLSPLGMWKVVENSSHFIMVDQPQEVIDGLKSIVEQIATQ